MTDLVVSLDQVGSSLEQIKMLIFLDFSFASWINFDHDCLVQSAKHLATFMNAGEILESRNE